MLRNVSGPSAITPNNCVRPGNGSNNSGDSGSGVRPSFALLKIGVEERA